MATQKEKIAQLEQRNLDLEDALEGMVEQFAYWHDNVGGYTTGGLSALEQAFDTLGWSEPHPAPEAWCDEVGCKKQISMGTPTKSGYRRTCGPHGIEITSSVEWMEWRRTENQRRKEEVTSTSI